MSILRTALFAALAFMTLPLVAQTTLSCNTSGVVPRITGTPFIPGCPTTPFPHYFAVSGSISQRPAFGQEIRLLVRPRRLDGSYIPGCEWVTQCQRGFVLPDNSFVVIGQFGSSNVPRTFFAGQSADVMFALVDISANVPVCISNPAAVSIAVSNVTTVQIDPTMPTFHDFQLPCTSTVMDSSGSPTPGQNIQFTLPSVGAIMIGLYDTIGFPLGGCRSYVTFPLLAIPTDGTGALSLPVPFNPALVGVDFGAQGVTASPTSFDLSQPTMVSIR